MQIIKQVKCELTSAEKDLMVKTLHNDDLIDLVNNYINAAFQLGLEYDGEG